MIFLSSDWLPINPLITITGFILIKPRNLAQCDSIHNTYHLCIITLYYTQITFLCVIRLSGMPVLPRRPLRPKRSALLTELILVYCFCCGGGTRTHDSKVMSLVRWPTSLRHYILFSRNWGIWTHDPFLVREMLWTNWAKFLRKCILDLVGLLFFNLSSCLTLIAAVFICEQSFIQHSSWSSFATSNHYPYCTYPIFSVWENLHFCGLWRLRSVFYTVTVYHPTIERIDQFCVIGGTWTHNLTS